MTSWCDDHIHVHCLFKVVRFGKPVDLNSPVMHGQHDFHIHVWHGKFYLILSYRRAVQPTKLTVHRQRIAAIDPGVRVPLTAYSPKGSVDKIGTNALRVLAKHVRRIDRGKRLRQGVCSRVAWQRECQFVDRKGKRKQRRRIRRAVERSSQPLKGKMNSLIYESKTTYGLRYPHQQARMST